jgi:hypothetical protein
MPALMTSSESWLFTDESGLSTCRVCQNVLYSTFWVILGMRSTLNVDVQQSCTSFYNNAYIHVQPLGKTWPTSLTLVASDRTTVVWEERDEERQVSEVGTYPRRCFYSTIIVFSYPGCRHDELNVSRL